MTSAIHGSCILRLQMFGNLRATCEATGPNRCSLTRILAAEFVTVRAKAGTRRRRESFTYLPT
jgi:hypothetical protein